MHLPHELFLSVFLTETFFTFFMWIFNPSDIYYLNIILNVNLSYSGFLSFPEFASDFHIHVTFASIRAVDAEVSFIQIKCLSYHNKIVSYTDKAKRY